MVWIKETDAQVASRLNEQAFVRALTILSQVA